MNVTLNYCLTHQYHKRHWIDQIHLSEVVQDKGGTDKGGSMDEGHDTDKGATWTRGSMWSRVWRSHKGWRGAMWRLGWMRVHGTPRHT